MILKQAKTERLGVIPLLHTPPALLMARKTRLSVIETDVVQASTAALTHASTGTVRT